MLSSCLLPSLHALDPITPTLVDQLLLDGTRHIVWLEFPAHNFPNPGAWGKTPYNPISYEWMRADEHGNGATIPPYDLQHIWYQSQVEIGLPTGGSHTERLSLFPDYQGNELSYLARGFSIAAATEIGPLQLSVSGYAIRRADTPVWDYTYVFRNLDDETMSGLSFFLEEDDEQSPPHAGTHDEFAFRNSGAAFAYDLLAPVSQIGIHNYSWSGLALEAGQAIAIGFSDVHGPTLEEWAISSSEGTHYEGVNRLPVPTVPDRASSALLLMLSVLPVLLWERRRRA